MAINILLFETLIIWQLFTDCTRLKYWINSNVCNTRHVRLFDRGNYSDGGKRFSFGRRDIFNRLIDLSLGWWGKYWLGKLRRGIRRRDVAADNKSGKSRCWLGELKKRREGWRDLMIGGGGGSHLPKVLDPAKLAFDKNRLRFNIRWVLYRRRGHHIGTFNYLSWSVPMTNSGSIFYGHDLIVGWSLLN